MTKLTDYEIEKNNRNALVLKDIEKLNQIIKALGLEVEPRNDDGTPCRAYASGNFPGTNYGLHLTANDYAHKGRIYITGDYPRYADGGYVDVSEYVNGNRTSPPSITVSYEKTVEQIAKDINKRLMPEYQKHLDKVLVRVNANTDYNDRCALNLVKVTTPLNITLKPQEVKDHKYYQYNDGCSIDIKVFQEDVNIEMNGLAPDAARQIVELWESLKIRTQKEVATADDNHTKRIRND